MSAVVPRMTSMRDEPGQAKPGQAAKSLPAAALHHGRSGWSGAMSLPRMPQGPSPKCSSWSPGRPAEVSWRKAVQIHVASPLRCASRAHSGTRSVYSGCDRTPGRIIWASSLIAKRAEY
eukprot:CAMPEP_0170276092 /NCGR_PEP_ID=MMETSP0116_2-20130129/38031_1 /TAXON_ID=400756 /ORGANISM="Durinskia baltica, Strain CSIRO CS-38" /LENGTH=118 /DNA_ID=CAMNT_0010527365 /DNA_START=155 /DNA_END=510 /DNA_ORIENTATION=-